LVGQINDAHVHIGKQPMINQSWSISELFHYKNSGQVSRVLIMSAGRYPTLDNSIIRQLSSMNDWIYGLHWVTSIHDPIAIGDGIVGAKYHGAYFKFPIKPFMPFLKSLDKQNGILLVHCGRFMDASVESDTSFIHALDIAEKYPNIKIILAHMGGTDTTICKVAIDMSIFYRNVYFDTSGITTPYILEYALEKMNSEYILYGSDSPWCNHKAMYETVNAANISEESKQNILCDNFLRLIK